MAIWMTGKELLKLVHKRRAQQATEKRYYFTETLHVEGIYNNSDLVLQCVNCIRRSGISFTIFHNYQEKNC